MALKNPSLFLYGFEVTPENQSIDFRAVALETPRMATLNLGFYSLNSLAAEIVRALSVADPSRTYAVTVDRTIAGGTQNRVTITTITGTHLELLFGSGPRSASTVAPLIGFHSTDYTGALTYTGFQSAGIALVPNFTGHNYLGPDFWQKNFGQVNVSASGLKEAIVFSIQKFIQVQFKYIPEATWSSAWTPLFAWMMQQRELEFTPDITDPATFYPVTLETSTGDGKGLAFKAREMLAEGLQFLYDTGVMSLRLVPNATPFIGG